MSKLKNCPYCAEEIFSAATKCKHCKSMLETESVKSSQGESSDSKKAGNPKNESNSVSNAKKVPNEQPHQMVNSNVGKPRGRANLGTGIFIALIIGGISLVVILGRGEDTLETSMPNVEPQTNIEKIANDLYGEALIAANNHNFDIATDLLFDSARQGNEEALAALNSNEYATTDLLLQLSEEGNGRAQLVLGNRYLEGIGVIANFDEALRLYNLAANQGVAAAQIQLGAIYYEGENVQQDKDEAMSWYQLAAEQGSDTAQRWTNLIAEEIEESARNLPLENYMRIGSVYTNFNFLLAFYSEKWRQLNSNENRAPNIELLFVDDSEKLKVAKYYYCEHLEESCNFFGQDLWREIAAFEKLEIADEAIDYINQELNAWVENPYLVIEYSRMSIEMEDISSTNGPFKFNVVRYETQGTASIGKSSPTFQSYMGSLRLNEAILRGSGSGQVVINSQRSFTVSDVQLARQLSEHDVSGNEVQYDSDLLRLQYYFKIHNSDLTADYDGDVEGKILGIKLVDSENNEIATIRPTL